MANFTIDRHHCFKSDKKKGWPITLYTDTTVSNQIISDKKKGWSISPYKDTTVLNPIISDKKKGWPISPLF